MLEISVIKIFARTNCPCFIALLLLHFWTTVTGALMKKLHLKYEGKKTGRVRISVAKRMGGFMLIICLVNSLEERFLKFPNDEASSSAPVKFTY